MQIAELRPKPELDLRPYITSPRVNVALLIAVIHVRKLLFASTSTNKFEVYFTKCRNRTEKIQNKDWCARKKYNDGYRTFARELMLVCRLMWHVSFRIHDKSSSLDTLSTITILLSMQKYQSKMTRVAVSNRLAFFICLIAWISTEQWVVEAVLCLRIAKLMTFRFLF